jgi:uncharacterized protein
VDASDPLATTQDERTMALLAHVLQLIGWWIAPLIIFLVKRDSRFVSFHALQALLLQICHVIVAIGAVVLWMVFMFTTIARQGVGHGAPPPPMFFVFFPLIWLVFLGFWVLVLVVAIVYGIKAGRGEWAEYPVLGGIARNILKIGPGGAVT